MMALSGCPECAGIRNFLTEKADRRQRGRTGRADFCGE